MSTPPLQDQIIAAIRRISQEIESYSRYLWHEYDLTAPQLGVLRELQRETQATPSALAEELRISPQTIAGILKRLEERKLIARSKHSADGRSVVLQLTEAGTKLSNQAPALLRERFTRELDQLQEWERTQILATLQRVGAMMSAAEVEPLPFLCNELGSLPGDEHAVSENRIRPEP